MSGARLLLAVAAGALAFGLRWHALEQLPADWDETPYLHAAQELAGVLRSGDLAGLMRTNPSPEHPQLMKLLFAAAILPAPESAPSPARKSLDGSPSRLPEAELLHARAAAAACGALEVLLLACLSPLAGLLLAVHGLTVKYTSLVMLEALPALTSLGAVICYWRFGRTQRRRDWIASGVLLGLSAASKYMYAIAGVAILVDWLLVLRPAPRELFGRARPVLLWGGVALATFFAANPYFWPDPFWRLEFSLFYHMAYSDPANVGGYPLWQPFVWLATGAADPFWKSPDPWISLVALAGLDRLWREQRVFALWLGVALLFLLVWNTKWPHYVLILSAPLCLAAAAGASRLGLEPLRRLRARRAVA